MKTLTLFNAYKIARRKRRLARDLRGRDRFGKGGFGIAVNKDEYALVWQRYDRLVTKLEKAIVARLEAV
jgi:hypothetical protein